MPSARATLLVVLLCGLSTAGCRGGDAAGQAASPSAAATAPSAAARSAGATAPAASTSGSATASGANAAPTPARVGRPAASQRLTFAPQRIRLSSDGGVSAPVQRVDTGPGGELELPADPGVTGWWVSGALAGEVYGSVVLAGHIDSRERGIGFFAKLLDAEPGDRIELSGSGLAQTYVVRANEEVDKSALSTSTDIFDRAVPGRLVLLTCTGTFDPRTRHYDRNLVVTAYPVGEPRPVH